MILSDFEFRKSGETASEETLSQLEKEVGGSVDFGYRQFILSTNGGVCWPRLESCVLEYPILVFYSVEADMSGLIRVFHDFNEYRRGNDILPIASTLGDEEICLKIGQTSSPVLLASHGTLLEIAPNWEAFVATLSQPEEVPPTLEVVAQGSWDEVCAFVDDGGDLEPDGEISLLAQTIRQDNFPLFDRLVTERVGWGNLDEAVQTAVINNRLSFLKRLFEVGGSVQVAAELAHGPKRQEMRAYLQSLQPSESE
ncbi:SMI1/KNR4 family protein [Fuerstiella marisgermanici]|nr:SMI1/KNR4 family protein [Fuerstiella marisgermanici]